MISCRKDNLDTTISGRISINTASITKATDTNFELGDQIGMWFLNNGTPFTNASGNYKDNVLWSNTAQGWIAQEIVTYPTKDSKLDYYAYYPYDQAVATISDITAYTFTAKTDQNIANNYTLSDFVYTSKKGTSDQMLNVQFAHKLARITLNVQLGSEFLGKWPEIQAIKIGSVATQTTIDLSSGTVASVPSGAPTTVAAQIKTEYETDGTTITKVLAQAVVAPQQVAAGVDFIIIETKERNYTYTPTAVIDLGSSQSHNYNMTIHSKTLNINNVEITDWTTNWDTEGTIDRSAAYDFSTYAREFLDCSFTNLHRCYDKDQVLIALLSKEYLPEKNPGDTALVIVYPTNNPDITSLPQSGYIASTGQKVTWHTDESGTRVEVGEVPTDFQGVYLTADGELTLSPDKYTLTSPLVKGYTVTDQRAKQVGNGFGYDEFKLDEEYEYGLVKIGMQIWQKQNLKTSKLRNGYGLRIGKIDSDWTLAPSTSAYNGWFTRALVGTVAYGDILEGAYMPDGQRKDPGENYRLLAVREKYGMLYNFHAVNAHNEITPLPGSQADDYRLAIPNMDIPGNEDWRKLISFLKPSNTIDTKATGSETFPQMMTLLEKSGLINVYSGNVKYVSSNNRTQNFVNQGQGVSFWSSDIDQAGTQGTSWVWCSTGTITAPATTHPDFACESRFIREGHSVRLMTNLKIQ